MHYELSGTVMQTKAIDLEPGETVFSQTNCMCWMNDAVDMNTHTGGGFLQGMKRSFSGGSFFITNFTARGQGHVASHRASPAPFSPSSLEPASRSSAARRRSCAR